MRINKKILIFCVVMLTLISTAVTSYASTLLGTTDYFDDLVEYSCDADLGNKADDWEQTPMAPFGITTSYSTSYLTKNYSVNSEPGALSLKCLTYAGDTATFTLSMSVPVANPIIENVFGTNSGTYIQEAEYYLVGLKNERDIGQSVSTTLGGAGWPMTLSIKFFSDGMLLNNEFYPHEFKRRGEKVAIIAMFDYNTSVSDSNVTVYARFDDGELVCVAENIALYHVNGGTFSGAIGSLDLAMHGLTKEGTTIKLLGSTIYKDPEIPVAEFETESITGMVAPGEKLTVNYEYIDGVPEKDTQIKWYMCSDAEGNDATLVHSDTYSAGDDISKKQYTLTNDDLQGRKYIKATVTPKSRALFTQYATGDSVSTSVKPLQYEMGGMYISKTDDATNQNITGDIWSTDDVKINYISCYSENGLNYAWYAGTTPIGNTKNVQLTDAYAGEMLSCKISLKEDETKNWTFTSERAIRLDNQPTISDLKFKDRNDKVLGSECDNYTVLYPTYVYSDDGSNEGVAEYVWYVGTTADNMSEISGYSGDSLSAKDYVGKYISYSAKPVGVNGNKNGEVTPSPAILITQTDKVLLQSASFSENMPQKFCKGATIDISQYIEIMPTNADNVKCMYSIGGVDDTGRARFNGSKLIAEENGTVTVKVDVVCDLDAVSYRETITKVIEIADLVESLSFNISNQQQVKANNSLTITKSNILINGKSAELFNNAAEYQWTSANNSIATVTPSGVITGVAQGTTKITLTVSLGGNSKSCDLDITVISGIINNYPQGSGNSSSNGGYSTSVTVSKDLENAGTTTPMPDNKPQGFSDVPNNIWFSEAVNKLVELGVINGKTDTEFKPYDSVTRAEFAKIIALAFDLKKSDVDDIRYEDVSTDAWYYDYVKAVADSNVMNGDEGEFRPLDYLSREEAATVLYRLVSEAENTTSLAGDGFVDSQDISDWAVEAVNQMKARGFINGDDNGCFMPKKTCTRAEAAQMVYTLINR